MHTSAARAISPRESFCVRAAQTRRLVCLQCLFSRVAETMTVGPPSFVLFLECLLILLRPAPAAHCPPCSLVFVCRGKVLPAAKPPPPPQFPPLPPSAHQQRQQPPLPPAMQAQPPPQPPLPPAQPPLPPTQPPPLPPGASGATAAPPRARKSRWS